MYIFEFNPLPMGGIYLVFEGGSMNESEGTRGVTHLMEHLVCKTFDDMRDSLQRNGISYNAWTCDSMVVFYFVGMSERLDKFKYELVKRITGGLKGISEDQFIQERKTVVEEYLDCFNDQLRGNLELTSRKIFGYYNPIGNRKDIESFTYEDMFRVYDSQFANPTRIVEIGQTPSTMPLFNYQKGIEAFVNNLNFGTYEFDAEKVKTENKSSVIGIGTKKCFQEDCTALCIGLKMLGDGLNSPLYQEIREKRGLSYFSWSHLSEFGHFAYSLFGSCTENDRISELMAVYDNVFENVTNFLTKERFDICCDKTNVKLQEQKIFRYSDPDFLLTGSLLYRYRNISDLTYEKVIDVMKKYVNKDSVYLSVL